MKVDAARPNVLTLTATPQEVSALVAGARLALDVMRGDSSAPREAIQLLERVLGDYDRAVGRLRGENGRARRPSSDPTDPAG